MPLHPDETDLMVEMQDKVHALLANFKNKDNADWVTLWRKLKVHWNALCDSVSAADFRVSVSKGLSHPTADLYETFAEADEILCDLMYAMIEQHALEDFEYLKTTLTEMRTFLSHINYE
jgi:hypothetical protein